MNRYLDAPKKTYETLYELVKDKDYFVLTTNVDHCFQKAGFDKKRMFYTQGDYGLFQSVNPKIEKTMDNENWVMEAMGAQGFVKDSEGKFVVPDDKKLSMALPTDLIPKCPIDGSDVVMNLRSDDDFLEDEGWHKAANQYANFLQEHDGMHVLFLELGVGGNTPAIIKYPFWRTTKANESAVYACLNYGEAFCPDEIAHQSICIDCDIDEVLQLLKSDIIHS